MRPSLPRLVRVLRRSELASEHLPHVQPLPEPVRSDVKRPTLIELLLRRKAEAGQNYPHNVRIEPVLTKASYKGIPLETRKALSEVVKER